MNSMPNLSIAIFTAIGIHFSMGCSPAANPRDTGSDASGAGAGGDATSQEAGQMTPSSDGAVMLEASSPATLEGTCRKAILAQCGRWRACGNTAAAYASCTAFADLCPDFYFSDGSTRTLEDNETCVTSLEQLPC